MSYKRHRNSQIDAPIRAAAHSLLRRLYSKTGNTDRANHHLELLYNTQTRPSTQTALSYGNLCLKKGDTSQARDAFQYAANRNPQNSQAYYKLGFAHERLKNYTQAIEAYNRATLLGDKNPAISFRLARTLAATGQEDAAIAHYYRAISNNHLPEQAYTAIYALEAKAPMWKRLQTLREGAPYCHDDPQWRTSRAVLAAKMGYPFEAIDEFRAAEAIKPLTVTQKVTLALQLLKVGHDSDANDLLTTTAANDKGRPARIGPGAYLIDRGHWKGAISLLRSTLRSTRDAKRRADIQFEIGHAFDRQYLWQQAARWFRTSLDSFDQIAYRHYRLGVTLERSGFYRDSFGPYACALQLEPSRSHWWYRLGEAARKAGELEVAHEALQQSLTSTEITQISCDPQDGQTSLLHSLASSYLRENLRNRRQLCPTDPRSWTAEAEHYLREGDKEAAAKLYSEIEYRTAAPPHSLLSNFSQNEFESGDKQIALHALSQSRHVRFPDGLNLSTYTAPKARRCRSLFAQFMEDLPLDERTILFESNHGASIGCHPLAIFRTMLSDPRFDNFRFVWAHTAEAEVPEEVTQHHRVALAEIHSDLYLKHLATAKYLVNNVTFPPYYLRRDGQVYMNTWHGTPLKTLGRSMRQGLLEYENIARNFVQATHIIAPNSLTKWALLDEHRIDRYATAAIKLTGSPRLDRLVSDRDSLRDQVRRTLNILPNEHVVLYAPTWRGGVSDRSFDTEQLLEDLQAMSSIDGVKVLFRAHRLSESLVSSLDLPVETVPHTLDTNDLLAGVDTLVTDYSSIGFDFLVTHKRLIYYVPDFEGYTSSRGLYLAPDEFPGYVCETRTELVQLIESEALPSVKSANAIARFAPHEDGRASQRAVNFLMQPPNKRSSSIPTIVIHASLIPNGIASALLSLLERLDPDCINVVLVVEASVMRREEDRQTILRRLPEYVNLAFRIGDIVATAEEQWAVGRSYSADIAASQPLEQLTATAWRRDARRTLGSFDPSVAIEFDGYASLWSSFIAAVGDSKTRRFIWQHNQLVQEWSTKYPELAAVFRLYKLYDGVVSVSSSLMTENKEALQRAGFQVPAPFHAVPNVIDSNRIHTLAESPVDPDLASWFTTPGPIVVSVGRLSPEKNFQSLVECWPQVIEQHPQARLVIIGDGILRATLETRISQLKLSDSITLAGQRENPYSHMKRADLFVLPSTHEGEPVVIFEAMSLAVPTAAAYTPGTKEALEAGYGELIKHDVNGLATDISRILKDPSAAVGHFDPIRFSDSAVRHFISLIGDTQFHTAEEGHTF